jgi:hypothetical protein
LGQPLCPECFDYDGAVLWNAVAPELWRRTTIAIRRQLARLSKVPVRQLNDHVRLRFTKVIEYQARGSIHVHAVLRLDGPDSDLVAAPSAGWSVELLEEAIRAAAAIVRTPIPGDAGKGGDRVGWGEQIDVQPLAGAAEGGQSETRRVAAYIAKYATKSTDDAGALDRRLRRGQDIDALIVDDHHRDLVEAAWRLGSEPQLASFKLRHWAHTLGYRGHWSTRSRRYSTTLTNLRQARRDWINSRRFRDPLVPVAAVGHWVYAGSGYRTCGDAWLVETAQRRRLETMRDGRSFSYAPQGS